MSWKVNPQVVVQRLGDSMVLVNLATDRILELNDSAATLFELLEEGLDEGQMQSRLASQFEIEEQALRIEMTQIIEALIEEQAVISANA